jgi:hypothetical protein
MRISARSVLQYQPNSQESYEPAKVVHSGGEPMKVRLNAKPYAKVARHWTQRRVAGMSYVCLVAAKSPVGLGTEMACR